MDALLDTLHSQPKHATSILGRSHCMAANFDDSVPIASGRIVIAKLTLDQFGRWAFFREWEKVQQFLEHQ